MEKGRKLGVGISHTGESLIGIYQTTLWIGRFFGAKRRSPTAGRRSQREPAGTTDTLPGAGRLSPTQPSGGQLPTLQTTFE